MAAASERAKKFGSFAQISEVIGELLLNFMLSS